MVYVLILLLIAVGLVGQIKPDLSFTELAAAYADDHSHFFKWKGINVHYKDVGNGLPMIFLHGSSSSLHTWDKLAGHLKDGYRVIRMDLPGFGLTGPHPQQEYSVVAYEEFLSDFIAHLGLDNFILAGNSWGGVLAWYYAARHPDKVSALILIASAGYKMGKVLKKFKVSRSKIERSIFLNTLYRRTIKSDLNEMYADHRLIDKATINRYYHLMLLKGNRKAFLDFIEKRKFP